MAASREKGVVNRLKDGGSMRPARRRLRMPMRLLPRVGERPAGADMGALDRLLLSFLAGDLGFNMERGCGETALTGLYGERPSLLLGMVEVEDDLVRKKVGALKKSLLRPSELDLERLNRMAGSTFSKSWTSRSSAAFRLPGEETGMAKNQLAQLGRPYISWLSSHGPMANKRDDQLRRGLWAAGRGLTALYVLHAGQALQPSPIEGREWLAYEGGHGADMWIQRDRTKTNKHCRARRWQAMLLVLA